MPPKSKSQEDLIKRRLAQKICKRRRYAEIKNDPELSELEERKRRERYQNKKKQEVNKKKSSRALKEQRKKWRENSKRCKIWIEACGRLDLLGKTSESLRHTHICSLHFQKQMYGKNSLKKTAIPVLLLPGKETRSIHTQTDPEIKDLFKVSKKQKLSDEKCKDITEKQILTGCDKFLSPQLGAIVKTSESSGVEQPSCSSFADSDMEEEHPEEKSEPPSPTTWLEIKQEVLWDGEQSSKEPGTAQAEQGAACGKEAAPPQVERGERGERSILEELRREMGTVARRDEVSSGLEQIRQEIRELAQGDEFDAFGRYVASLLRNMRPRRASHAQPLLINLLAAEMMKQNDDDLA